MTTSAAQPNPFIQRAGHYFAPAMPYYSVVAGVVGVLSPAENRPGWVEALIYCVFIVYMLLLVAHVRAHAGRLCEICVAGMPLDAPARAERNRPLLRLFHHLDGHVHVGPLPLPTTHLAYVFGGLFLALTATAILGLPPAGRGLLMLVLFFAPCAVFQLAQNAHARYQPYCPWCDHGRGDDELAPEPTPDPSISR